MSILIVSATRLEIKPAIKSLNKQGCRVIISGVGCAPSAYSILKAVQVYKPTLIIQAGIAGCFDIKYSLGDVLAVEKDGFGDLGVIEKNGWKSVIDMGFINANKRPFKSGWLSNPHKKILRSCELPQVFATTVNEISTNKQRIRLLKEQGCVLETMEGAALHYVSLMEGIPFLQIRSISNYVGERNKTKWKMGEAISNLNKELVRLVVGL